MRIWRTAIACALAGAVVASEIQQAAEGFVGIRCVFRKRDDPPVIGCDDSHFAMWEAWYRDAGLASR